MRIGELAKALGTTTKTLRHYERMSLLRPPQRTENDHRIYGEADLRNAREIMGLRR
ncbi:MAG: MerR family DNA-binding transcriptional regulator, partial [Alphaproteobacteria bacterium]|nr:MerR family DNA-binding transcriptional regulator [Alphaproteobacteria bacterium]